MAAPALKIIKTAPPCPENALSLTVTLPCPEDFTNCPALPRPTPTFFLPRPLHPWILLNSDNHVAH